MFVYNGKEFQPYAKQEELEKVFMPLAIKLKQKYTNIQTLQEDERNAILTGLIVKVVDSLGEDTRLAAEVAGLSIKKLKGIAGVFSNGLSLTLLERNSIDTKFVQETAFKVMFTRLHMMAGKFKIYDIIKEPYRPIEILNDDALYKKFIIAYKTF